MAEKILKTRIQLRYDTLANWTTNDPVLKAGELAIATIEVAAPANKQLPPVMFKVGDGTSKFSELDWASALAADVYDWAKKTGIEVNTSGTGTVVTGIAWDTTNKRLNVTKGNVDLSGYVPITRKVNNKALSTDITLGASDVGVTEANFPGLNKVGTVTGITMNEEAKTVGANGVVDLGTVITSHQDISGKQDKAINIDGITAKTVEGALKEIDAAAATAQTTANGKYSLPTGGIPKSDLASGVQTSLGKADTALQSHQTITTGTANGTIAVAGKDVAVAGLKDLAYKDSLTKSDVGLGNVENKTLDTSVTTSGNYVTSGAVKTYVDTAIGAVKQFQYEVVDALPTASADTMGKIYLVADAHGTQDNYDEYITIDKGANETPRYVWEKIGNTDIDLTNYVKTLSGTANSGVVTNLTKSGNTLTVTSTSLAVNTPTASGTALAFIDSVSQAANGKITATKKTVSDATQSANGLMTAADKIKLDGIAEGANNYTLPVASSDAIGGVKPGTTSGKNYGVQVAATGEMTVNVPWENTEYSDMTGATASAAGTHGLVPAPAAGKQTSFLRGDGTWVVPNDTNTWRQINVNGTQLKGTGTGTGAVNFKNGSNVTITGSGNDITIAADSANDAALKDASGATIFSANASEDVTITVIDCGNSSDIW